MLSTTLDDLSTRFTCVRLTRRKKKKPLGSPATPKKKPQVGMSEIVSPMNTKYPTFVWGVPADADLNSSAIFPVLHSKWTFYSVYQAMWDPKNGKSSTPKVLAARPNLHNGIGASLWP